MLNGVELGKRIANGLGQADAGDEDGLAAQDSSTKGLIAYCRANRKQGRFR
ncbi:hypothetical protein VR010_02490 [Actinomycetaceae bacterium L2_0104]